MNWKHILFSLLPFDRRDSPPLERIIAPYRLKLSFIVVLGLVASILETAGIGLLIPLVSLVSRGGMAGQSQDVLQAVLSPLASFDILERAVIVGVVIAVLLTLKGMLQAANAIYISHVDGLIGDDLRNALADRLIDLDYNNLLKHDTARIIEIVCAESALVRGALQEALSAIPAMISLLAIGLFLCWVSPVLAVVAIGGAILVQVVLVFINRRQEELSIPFVDDHTALWGRTADLARSAKVIRLFGRRDWERQRFGIVSDTVRLSIFRLSRLSAIMVAFADVAMGLLLVGIFLLGFALGYGLPLLAGFIILLTRAQPHSKVVSLARSRIAQAHKAFSEVDWLLSTAPVPRPATVVPFVEERLPIVFHDVTFAYPSDPPALQSASFAIEHGQATALIGPSGSGKSTIVNLITRLIAPQSGSITFGSTPIDGFDLQQWRSSMAAAGQDLELVEGTLRENIAYGRDDATFEEIHQAATVVGALPFIDMLPNGFDTHVGERGLRLSGGQRQRIGLARALVRKPRLLILDEAMNAIDAMSEEDILRVIEAEGFFQSLLLISHRKSTLAACSYGIVLRSGCVVETGPLASLDYVSSMSGKPEDRTSGPRD